MRHPPRVKRRDLAQHPVRFIGPQRIAHDRGIVRVNLQHHLTRRARQRAERLADDAEHAVRIGSQRVCHQRAGRGASKGNDPFLDLLVERRKGRRQGIERAAQGLGSGRHLLGGFGTPLCQALGKTGRVPLGEGLVVGLLLQRREL